LLLVRRWLPPWLLLTRERVQVYTILAATSLAIAIAVPPPAVVTLVLECIFAAVCLLVCIACVVVMGRRVRTTTPLLGR